MRSDRKKIARRNVFFQHDSPFFDGVQIMFNY